MEYRHVKNVPPHSALHTFSNAGHETQNSRTAMLSRTNWPIPCRAPCKPVPRKLHSWAKAGNSTTGIRIVIPSQMASLAMNKGTARSFLLARRR